MKPQELRILIIVDVPTSRKRVAARLEPYGHCSSASGLLNGFTLFDNALQHEPFDIVFLNVPRSGLVWLEVLRRLRALERLDKSQ